MPDSVENESSPKAVSPWQYKPWWCQPWSILLTGVGLIAGSWFALKLIWLTVLIAIPLLIWMGFFLLLWPKLVMEQMALHPEQDL